jgi:hypothetical protein
MNNDRFGSIFNKDDMAQRIGATMNTQMGLDSHNMTGHLMGIGS